MAPQPHPWTPPSAASLTCSVSLLPQATLRTAAEELQALQAQFEEAISSHQTQAAALSESLRETAAERSHAEREVREASVRGRRRRRWGRSRAHAGVRAGLRLVKEGEGSSLTAGWLGAHGRKVRVLVTGEASALGWGPGGCRAHLCSQ